MKTLLGNDIPGNTRAVLYLGELTGSSGSFRFRVDREVLFGSPFEALQAYANIHNPASQLASGKTHEKFLDELRWLHDKVTDQAWLQDLNDSI